MTMVSTDEQRSTATLDCNDMKVHSFKIHALSIFGTWVFW